jgi:hypothetical protein
VPEETQRRPRFIPRAQGQQYLLDKFGIPKVSERRLRDWIKLGIYPQPVQVTPGRQAWTDEQLDRHAQTKLALIGQLDPHTAA